MLSFAALSWSACPANHFQSKWTQQCIQSGPIDFTDCWFGDCTASADSNGGAISFTANRAESLSILTNCAFTRCRAVGSGGAMYDRLSLSTTFTRCCAYFCDALGGAFYSQQTYIPANFSDCSFSKCSPLEGSFNTCSGPGALDQCGDTRVLRCNFTDNSVLYAGSDLWSYFRPSVVNYCIFNRGKSELAMIYSVYQGNKLNVTLCSFLNSTSPAFHSHGSTGGSVITARNCLFSNVGGFSCEPDDDALVILINCDFSNSTIWTSGSVSCTGGRFNVSRSVAIHEAVVDRECLWYGPTVPISRMPATTALDGHEMKVLWIVVGCASGVIVIVVLIVGVSLVRRQRRAAARMRPTLNPYTE
jgi:hypothetical protein